MAPKSTTIYRPYNHKYQPRCINLRYIAEMSFLASTSTKDDVAQPIVTSTSKIETNADDKKTKSKPAKKEAFAQYQEKESHSPKCWSWLTDDKDFDGIIETTKPYEKRHEHFGSKNPLLCIVKIPNLKKVTQKIVSRKKMSESQRDRYTFTTIDLAKPILGGHGDESDNQEVDSINPCNVDAFIREDDASWNENISVVEMHEWLPAKPISLQLLTSDSHSIRKKSFGDDASLASFDLETFNADHFSANNVFRQSGFEIITTPSTAPDTSFFSDCDSKDDDKAESSDASDEDASSSKEKKRPTIETNNTSSEGIRVDIQELLNITQSNSFGTVEFYEEDEEGAADDSDTTSAYFSSDNLTQVYPRIVPSVSSSVASSIRGSEADDLLSIPSFPSSSSWDDDEEEDQLVFEDQDAEVADENGFDQEEVDGIGTTEAAYFSCLKVGGFLSLMM